SSGSHDFLGLLRRREGLLNARGRHRLVHGMAATLDLIRRDLLNARGRHRLVHMTFSAFYGAVRVCSTPEGVIVWFTGWPLLLTSSGEICSTPVGVIVWFT